MSPEKSRSVLSTDTWTGAHRPARPMPPSPAWAVSVSVPAYADPIGASTPAAVTHAKRREWRDTSVLKRCLDRHHRERRHQHFVVLEFGLVRVHPIAFGV